MTFDLRPESFKEQLHRARYRGLRSAELSFLTWITKNLHNNYVGFEWARPGETWGLELEQGQWEEPLRSDTTNVRIVEQIKEKQGVSSNVVHGVVAKTSTFR